MLSSGCIVSSLYRSGFQVKADNLKPFSRTTIGVAANWAQANVSQNLLQVHNSPPRPIITHSIRLP
jgi:hypothetical protein